MPHNHPHLPISGIRDNHRRGTVGDFLKTKIKKDSTLSIASAYFTIYAFDALKEHLLSIKNLNFLFGEPRFIKSLDPQKIDKKTFQIEDDGLQLSNRLVQNRVAKECAAWIADKVQIRSVKQSNLLHGKMYHVAHSGVEDAIMGSSNFTVRGLGLGTKGNNIELNLEVDSRPNRRDLKAWFDELWNDAGLVEDVKQEVLLYLEQLYQNNAPEFIYYKTLFHIFEQFLADQARGSLLSEEIHIVDTEIWKALFEFQKDGVKGAINKILTHNGCLIADSVGLGKTYEALAVIKYFELLNYKILVLCPKKLRENWIVYQAQNNSELNPFISDRFSYTVLSHTDLSRDSGFSGDINLETINWGNYDLVVIDESHNFRNNIKGKRDEDGNVIRKSRYERLMEDIIQSGIKTRVLLLSATPVNNDLKDLRNQLYFLTEGRDNAFSESIGITSLKETLANAQRTFTKWANKSEERQTSALLENLSSAFFKLLDELTIARSRKHIQKYYSDTIAQLGGFPKRLKPISVIAEIDLEGRFMSYDELNDEISNYQLSLFNPSKYILPQYRDLYEARAVKNFTQKDREYFLIGMMKVNFLKRLESSVRSFAITMNRTIEKIEALQQKIEHFKQSRDQNQEFGFTDLQVESLDDEEFQEAMQVGKSLTFQMVHLDNEQWLKDLRRDKKQLNILYTSATQVSVERDAKLAELKKLIFEKVKSPTTNKQGQPNRKVLVFTAFADTAEYLYKALQEWATTELNVYIALVRGGTSSNKTTFGRNDFNHILTNFSPTSKKRAKIASMPQDAEIDLLIATDCISEGQNLQDCDYLINYDIHWNPVRIIQRFGRIDRIGSVNSAVQLVNFWPTQDLDKYITLKKRVEARMALVDIAATFEDNLLEPDEIQELIQSDLNYRARQLLRLKDEVLDLEDFSESVALNEFTLDDFRIELSNYIESNRKSLQNAPLGLYAVVPTNPDYPIVAPGIIFCLKQKGDSSANKAVNPLQPYFLVYIREDEEVRFKFAQPKQILEMYRLLCAKRTVPYEALCNLFDQQTNNGTNMTPYNNLLQRTVDSIIGTYNKRMIGHLQSSRSAVLVDQCQQIKATTDFDLFFVIELKGSSYTIEQLDGIVYEINKLFPMPVIVLFRHGVTLTLSIIDRRPHKRDESKDVFEKVKHIKDIPFSSPTHTKIKKLFDLSLVKLHQKHDFSNFNEFHEALQKTLDGNVKFLKEAVSEDSTRLYLQEIGRIPLLRPSEEIELARKIADLLKLERVREQLESKLERTPHDAEWADAVQMPLSNFWLRLQMGRKAKKQMVESNLRMVVSIAKKYQNRGLEFLDLIQEGNLGLIRATEKFNPEKGNRFSTYAYWWIKQEITRALAEQSRTIRLPVHINDTIFRINKTAKILFQEKGRNPTTREIAAYMEMTVDKLQYINQCAKPVISLNIQVGEEDSTLGDLIEFNGKIPEEQVSKAILRENLESVLNTLSPREQEVLRLRYGLDNGQGKSLQQIGNIFNVTRERIRQIEATALEKLRSPKCKTFLEETIPRQLVRADQTKNVTCPKNRQTEANYPEILHHLPFEKNSEESDFSTRYAPAQTVDLTASNPLQKTANIEEENTNQTEFLSVDMSETNRNQANSQEASRTLPKLKETDLNGAAIKPMQQKPTDLHQQVASLENIFSQLVPKLSEALQELQDSGTPLSAELILELGNSRNQFNALRARVLELAEALVLSPTQKEPEIDSLTGLKSLLEDALQAEEQKEAIAQVRQQALRVLERVLVIAHRDNNDFQPLLECQEKARELQHTISESQPSDLHSDTQALAEGNHSFAQLLTLIEQGDELDDDRSADLHDSVAESFGRTLATAAVRERLIVQEESVPDLTSPSTIKESKIPTRTQPPEPETAPSVEHPVVDKSEVAQAESEMSKGKLLPSGNGFAERAYTPSNTKVIPDSQPVEKLIATAQTVTPLPPKIETHKDEPESESEQTEEDIQPQYQLTLNDIAQQSTASVSGDISEEHPLALHEQIWQLLNENQLSLAFHLARCLESKYPDFQPHLPSGIIRGVILGRYVRYDVGVGEIANSLRNGFTKLNNNCFLDGESEWNQVVSLLLATSALRPALLAPNTNASEILHSLRLGEGLNQLYEYCKIIAEYGSKGLALDTTAIKTVRNQAEWEAKMASLRQRVEVWWTHAPRLNMIYGPAKAVWSEWIKPEQLIYSLLFPIRENDLNRLDVAKNYLARLSSETKINEEVKRTQRELGLIRGSSDAITGKALNQIRQHIHEAVEFACKWISFQESRVDESNEYAQNLAQELKQDLSSLHQAVLKELDSFDMKNFSVLVKAGISCCRTAVEDIHVLFEPNELLSTVEPEVKYLLNSELLKISSLPMNSDWQPEDGSQDLFVKELFNLVAQPHYDWQQAFDMRSNSRDHEATGRIIEYLQANSETSIDIVQLEQQRNHLIDNCRVELEIAVKETRKKLEGDVALGLLGESERLDYAAQIESIENAIATTLRFSDKFKQLRALGEAIKKNRSEKINEVRDKLLQEIGSEHPAYVRICSVLDIGDVLTANEYVDMVNRGQSIPEPEKRRDAFVDFFKKYTALEAVLEPTDRNRTLRRELINDISKGRNIGSLHMQQVPGAQAKQASEMLEAWFTAKNNRETITQDNARKILKSLGFNTAQLTINQVGDYARIEFYTEPIQDRNRCPVPTYGSEANGHYCILCVWGRPTEEDILNAVEDTFQGSGVLVFHFGRMTKTKRRGLAHLCQKRRRKFIVIDDTLMFFLCGERGARLPVLFDCTLPFTFLQPYTTTAGLVPPEMFYGRERERESVIDPSGSCLIYGGRQLGKTVLLKYVHRTFHDPHQGRIALLLDIKEVGRKQPLNDIWLILIRELEKLQILDASQRNPLNPRSLEQIKSWLEVDTQRRILLLLDEADNFLEADSKEDFPRCDELRRLMLETNRRFKVVFAGLHNVLRTTRQVNHPLAHFGKPICIGPLLNNGEMRAARALVERPLASLGYRFESLDLITRILSQTNYYPSLIQLYCDQLLKHITNPDAATFDPQTSPPYVITSGHVEEAYQSQDLRQAIRDRFKLTLGLDKRYEVIAYSIAYGSLESAKGRVDGFSVSWIRDEILYWWKEGFLGRSSVDEIRALLEEMVGLGILRVTNEGYFTLRTPNVALLMGTPEEIQEELLRDREVPLEYEAATFRSTLGIKSDSRRSPLTAQQESKLQSHENGASIIFGCQAAGLGDLKIFLESAYVKKKEFFRYWDEISDQADFTRRLQESSRNRKKDGTTLIVVSSQCDWSEAWVNEAIQKVKRLKKDDSFMRVVFIADPQKAWQLLSQDSTGLVELEERAIPLKTWHDSALRHWLEDSNFPSDKKIREKIKAVTGNWSTLLQDFYQLSQSDPLHWEDCLQKLKERLDDLGRARELAQLMGFDDSQPLRERVLRDLVVLEEASAEDLSTIVEGASTTMVNRILHWADLLSLASPVGKKDDGKDYWSVDPMVKSILLCDTGKDAALS